MSVKITWLLNLYQICKPADNRAMSWIKKFPYLLPLVTLMMALLGIGYLYSLQSVSISEGNAFARVQVHPTLFLRLGTEFDVQWETDKINSIYVNGNGTVGVHQGTFSYDVCELPSFLIEFENGQLHNFQVQPFTLFHPLTIILLVAFVISLSVILNTLNVPIISPFGSYFASLYQLDTDSYWQINGIKWLGLLCSALVIFIAFLFADVPCQADLLWTVGEHFSIARLTLFGTGLTAFLGIFVLVVKPSLLRKASHLIQNLPYPLVILLVFIYWALTFHHLLILGTVVDWLIIVPTAFFVFLLGIMILQLRLGEDANTTPQHVSNKLPTLYNGLRYLMFGIIWLILYRAGWTHMFDNDVIQTLIGAILFILPGICLTLVLLPNVHHWSSLITFGLIHSLVLTALVWVIAMLLALSANQMQWMYTIIGLGFALYLIRTASLSPKLFQLETKWRPIQTLVLGIGMLSILIAIALINEPGIGHIDGDYRHYNPLVMTYAQDTQLTFHEPYLGTGNNMDYRLWLAFWTVPQSLIVNFSQTHILVNFHIIGSIIGMLAFVATYDFLRRLSVPEIICLASIPILTYFLVTHQGVDQFGSRFFRGVVQDKYSTAFVLVPIAIITVYEYLSQPKRKRLLFVGFALLTVMLGHATIYVYACIIIGLMTVLYVTFESKNWHHIIIIASIASLWMLAPFAARLASNTTQTNYDVDAQNFIEAYPERDGRSQLGENGEFLGINPELLNPLVYLVLIAVIILSIVVPSQAKSQYIVIPFAILLLVVFNPYTSTMLGWIVTPGQLWRIPWIVPTGILGGLAVWHGYRLSYNHLHIHKIRLNSIILILCGGLLILTYTLASVNPLQSPNLVNLGLRETFNIKRQQEITGLMRRYQSLAEVNAFIRVQTSEDIVALGNTPLQFIIPSIGEGINTLSWYVRQSSNIPLEEWQKRLDDNKHLFREELILEDFQKYVSDYDISYIVSTQPLNHIEELLDNSNIPYQEHQIGSLYIWQLNLID